MKRYLLIILLAGASLGAYAHQGVAITLGYAQPTWREGQYSKNASYFGQAHGRTDMGKHTLLKGFTAGLMYDADFIAGFGAAIGLNYTFGADVTKWTAKNAIYGEQLRTTSFYHSIEIPVDWQYKFTVAQSTYVIVYTGPTIALNLAADSKFYSRPSDQGAGAKQIKQTGESNWLDKAEDYGMLRYNVLWGVGAGFQYKQFFIRGGYDFGLLNAYQHTTVQKGGENVNILSRMDKWQVKLGMYLWQK